MAQSLSNVLVHIVFSTKMRKRYIKKDIRNELYAYMASLCKVHDSPAIKIGGIEDHIHLLINLSRSISIAKLVKEIKSNSSRWIKNKGTIFENFAWQNGYGVFSLGRSSYHHCINYIANQREHHKHFNYQEELITLLKKYDVTFNMDYLFD